VQTTNPVTGKTTGTVHFRIPLRCQPSGRFPGWLGLDLGAVIANQASRRLTLTITFLSLSVDELVTETSGNGSL
jgi:hypothetical protein